MSAFPEVPTEESPALASASKAFTILTREQKAALSRTLDGFVDCLVSASNPNPNAKSIVTDHAWHNRANWTEDEWITWETWGWYRHFCRMVCCFCIYLLADSNLTNPSFSTLHIFATTRPRWEPSLSQKWVVAATQLSTFSGRSGTSQRAKKRNPAIRNNVPTFRFVCYDPMVARLHYDVKRPTCVRNRVYASSLHLCSELWAPIPSSVCRSLLLNALITARILRPSFRPLSMATNFPGPRAHWILLLFHQ